ncbi:glycoside hydrolase family 76 protein [Dictyobacter kobayashii]|uniref:Glycosyl hydrolase n=1 Tax=Dictyobacter kobayashii TaxID=2014872 RepID=A0A402AUP9_9CHLR|nr:glycoside hydrolase family 76 protein [Dictyobacter kobayashii]GCE22850.1 hypothetical protein KDK_66500 [Dictyobacter kobayashii]
MYNYRAHVEGGLQTLQQWYNPDQCLWDSTGWWNAANILWAISDYQARTNSTLYANTIQEIFQKHSGGNFINDYYDDEGWWALAWIKAYDLTGQIQYLNMARTIFLDMEGGWDNHCGGGIWWSKERSYKNAIANELYFTIAAHLHQRVTHEDERAYYFERAYQGWIWFWHSGMINRYNLVNDGLNEFCQNNGGVTWTYNQGVILGGLTEMYRITRDEAYRDMAELIADAAISTLVDRYGILQEPCESGDCGADGPQFKGIFIRNLATLYEVLPKPAYQQFMLNNARAIVANNPAGNYQFGLKWSEPVDNSDAARQCSALDALLAAMSVESVESL